MKPKILKILLIAIIAVCASFVTASAVTKTEISVLVQGKNIAFSETTGMPFIDDNGRTQIPLRVVADSAGCSVDWDKISRCAIITSENISLTMPINKEHILMNGHDILIDTCAQIRDGRTYIPARTLLEALGYNVVWDATQKIIKAEKLSEREKMEYTKNLGLVNLKKGDRINFGYYEQDGNLDNGKETITWTVINVDGEKALLLSEKVLFLQPFQESIPNIVDGVIVGTGLGGGGPITWVDSTLRKELNCNFINEAFSSKERLCIPYVLNSNEERTAYLDVWWYRNGDVTFDKAFCIAQEEVATLLNEADRLVKPTAYAASFFEDENRIVPTEDDYVRWWLRSPVAYTWGSVAVGSDGNISKYRYNQANVGVRPAIWVYMADE